MKCPKCRTENTAESKFCRECAAPLGGRTPDSPEPGSFPPDINVSKTLTLETKTETLARGTVFASRYEILEELGGGGMGKVFRVYDRKLEEEVALKLIRPEIAADRRAIERFKNELKVARKITHKNVCKMYDLGEAEGTSFITMEYVRGEDLKSLIHRTKALTVGTSVSIARQVGEGLSEAHKLGIVHRDLKPGNVMIDKEGNARIMDFGIARSLEAKGITGEAVVIGTPEYMSPEQIEGSEVDKRSDIYSLGVILYEMVTGRVPFVGETALSIAMKHKSKSPQHPKEHNAQIPDDLSYLILRCLEKDKEKRYQSAAAVLSDLENIEKGVPTTDIVPPKKKHITSKEITVTFRLRKMLIPALTLAAAVIIGVIIWQVLFQKDGVSIPSEKRSIAVLPFEDLSPQKDQEYFCDGLADELINRLSNLENLRIPARTTAFSFKDKGLGIQEIAKRLEVENVLEGSIRKAGNKIRITVQLVNAADGYPFWSEKYERDEQDIFALQDEISLAIVDKINLRLLGRDKAIFIKRHTENLEAYNLYLEGRFFWNKRTEEAMIRAIKYFEQAIEKDSNYALAYVGIADAYNMLGRFNMLPPTEAYSKAKMSATKALAIDDKLAEAYTSLGFVKHFFDLDWSGADAAFKNAIRLNGNYATAHQWYGGTLLSKGQTEEAFKEIERALELDPLSLPIITSIGMIHYIARQFDQAIIHCKKALEIESTFPWAHSVLASSYLQNSLFEEAIAEFQKAVTLSGSSTQYLAELAHAYAVAGNRDKAVQIIEELLERSKQKYVPRIGIALVYAGLAEKDKALQWLENAIENEERSFDLVFLKVEPKWDSLCSDSRFKALLNKVKLE